MARAGIYKSEVLRARDRLLATGVYPSIDAVRIELGNTGSKATIHRYLKEIEEEEGGKTRAKVAVSEAIQDLVGRLAARLNEEADARGAELQAKSQAELANKQEVITGLQAELQSVRQQLEQVQQKLAVEKAEHTKTCDALGTKTLEATQSAQQVRDLREQLASAEQHRQSLEEKHLHARQALEHFRDAAKEQREQELRQHEQQTQYLQGELRKVNEALTAKQQAYIQVNQEGVRLVAELSRTQSELHQVQEEVRKLRPLKDALASEQKRTEELGRKLVEHEAGNVSREALIQQLQTQLNSLQENNRQLEISLAAAKAAESAKEQMIRNMLERLGSSATAGVNVSPDLQGKGDGKGGRDNEA